MKAPCPVCGATVRAVIPPGGSDATLVITRHKHNGDPCSGSRRLLGATQSREIVAAAGASGQGGCNVIDYVIHKVAPGDYYATADGAVIDDNGDACGWWVAVGSDRRGTRAICKRRIALHRAATKASAE